MQKRSAFTMVELVFVIVVIGILSAVAIPKLAATRDDAEVSRARAAIASLRNAIATERQKRILRGNFDDVNASSALGLLQYPTQDWELDTSDNTKIKYTGSGGSCTFTVANNLLKKDSCSVDGLSDL